ncbi:MAG: hypothetical protein R3B90_22975 [Planctomycetaceae bacterium]
MHRRLCKALILTGALAAPSMALAQSQPPGVLAREPETPVEMFDAAALSLRLSRPALARQYLQALIESKPDDATLLQLREQHGTALFLQMSRLEPLQPEGAELLELMNNAAQSQLSDPAFQEAMLRDLTGGTRERFAARNVLRALGAEGAAIVFAKLAEGTTPEEQELLVEALVEVGPVVKPLADAAMQSDNDSIQTIAADLLGRLDAREYLLHLHAVAFSPVEPPSVQVAAKRAIARIEHDDTGRADEVSDFRLAERLSARATELFAGRTVVNDPDAVGGQVRLWVWDGTVNRPVAHDVSSTSASVWEAERLARGALAMSPEDTQRQALLLGVLMWRDRLAAGWEQPVSAGAGTAHDLALALGPDLTRQTLELSLQHDNPAATMTSLQALSQNGSRGSLLVEGSPLLRALQAPHSRVQFVAANTIMLLGPVEAFPGAARVVDIFARGLSPASEAKMVVVDPNSQRGATFAGALAGLGLAPGQASTGREGFLIAAEEGNVTLAALHLNTIQWDLTQTVANLRADPRTKKLPIVVYGPPSLRNATRQKLKAYELVGYADDSGDLALIQQQIQPLLAQASVPPLSPAQRTEEQAASAYWLRHIGESNLGHVFPLPAAETALSAAVNQDEIVRDVIVGLGAIPRPSVQERLAQVALGTGFPASTRVAAAVQLAYHIQRFGRLINNKTVQDVEAAYRNESQPELQSSWAAVVGALGVTPAATTDELLRFPMPAIPLP